MKLSIFLLFFLIFEQVYCNSLDTITLNKSIKDDGSLLLSTGGTFALGFFSPGKSTNRYIGIWYRFSNQTIVWVANRDTPVPDSSGVLSLDGNGNLIIRSGSNLSDSDRVWTTNVSTTASGNRFFGQLLETGNLKLIHDNTVVWQSFDHPTNTMLPLMKLGLDRNTGLNRFLTSWKSEDDPGTGDFSLLLDITELPELIVKQGPNRLWRSGPWIGDGWTGSSQNLSNDFLKTIFTNNRDETSVVYSMEGASMWKLRVVLNESGVIQTISWDYGTRKWYTLSSQADPCDHYSYCGSYGNCDTHISSSFNCTCLPGFEPDWTESGGSSGCVRKKGQPICGKRDGFVKVENAKSPDTRTAHLNPTTGLEGCRQQCLDNCTCTAYASAEDQNLCITWHGELLDTRLVPGRGQDLYVRVGAVESGNGRNKKVVYIIVASIAVALALGAFIIWFMTVQMKKDRTRKETPMLVNTHNGEVSTAEKLVFDDDFPSFDFDTIVIATDNFSTSNKLGKGGFGTVYKGHLTNGLEIAVKRLEKSSDQGMEEFMNEVSLIAKLQHRNLVRLLGCCVQSNEKMLIYEYLPNKGLDSFIFNEEKRSMLNWEKRFNIILGIIRGMIYLHQDSRLRIIHRDLKVSNVLLDDELNPKISDFGMARIFRGDEMEVNTKKVVGTYGYMSPEYAMDGLFSTKSDVYSFGVLLLEIISGRRNSTYYRYNNINLIGHTWNLWKEGKTFEIIDPMMGDSCPKEEAMRCFQIGLLCVQELPMDRPSMSNIAFMLCNEVALPLPKQPTFTFKRHVDIDASDSSASAPARSISDHLTISQVVGR